MFGVSFRIILQVSIAFAALNAGAQESDVVMPESPIPPAGSPSMTPLKDGLKIAKVFSKGGLTAEAAYINVRLFPILKTHPSEPYPVAQIRDIVELQHPNGLQIFEGIKKVGPTAKEIQLNFRDEKIYFKNPIELTPTTEVPLRTVWIRSVNKNNPVRVIYNKGMFGFESDRSYRGEFTVYPTVFEYEEAGSSVSKPFWSLINVVKLEEYLYSVLPSEVPSYWHPQALRAQAIAARTYAVKELIEARKKDQPWDVDPTTQYQSYRGTQLEQPTTSAAADKTRNIVMTHKGQIFLAFFSANSGGVTCSAKECLELPDAPFAISKTDAIEIETRKEPGGTWSGCTSLPLTKYFLAEWGYASPQPDFPLPSTTGPDGKKRPPFETCLDQEFAELVDKRLSSDLNVKSIEVLSKSSSGRTNEVSVLLKSGVKIKLNEDGKFKIRRLTYGRQSYLFELKSPQSNGLIEFRGYGYGHGVGMSQWGAQLRANKYNQSYEQILKFYYNEIKFENLSQVN